MISEELSSFVVPNLYDSHAHWVETGEVASKINLSYLRSLEDLAAIARTASPNCGPWITGFGWDQNHFESELLLHKSSLDRFFPNVPVLFSRCDGHSSWVNQVALDILDLKTSGENFLPRDKSGGLTGWLLESAHIEALSKLPRPRDSEVMTYICRSQDLFLGEGFTHIRDMTSRPETWSLNQKLESQGQLKVHLEGNFVLDQKSQLKSLVEAVGHLKTQNSKHLKVRGLKIFLDGSLGSDTAWIQKASGEFMGQRLWEKGDFQEILEEVWKAGLEFSVHTLGDQAVHQALTWTREVLAKNSVSGVLNLEHVEVLRSESLPLMKPLHLRCHLQSGHWLQDRLWLERKLGERSRNAFPWSRLYKNKVPMFFGSDSPIDPPQLRRWVHALKVSAKEGIESFPWQIDKTFSYPYSDGLKTKSHFKNGLCEKVEF